MEADMKSCPTYNSLQPVWEAQVLASSTMQLHALPTHSLTLRLRPWHIHKGMLSNH